VFRENHGIEKERDEIGEVVGVKVRKENMGDAVTTDAGLDEVAQGARAEIEQHGLVGLDQIAGCRTGRMDVGTGTKDCQSHIV
jgi:hypothetical protein